MALDQSLRLHAMAPGRVRLSSKQMLASDRAEAMRSASASFQQRRLLSKLASSRL